MRRFLLQMALFLVFGGWCASANAAWDLTNQIPITKPEKLQDGMVVYFRGQCNASSAQMVLDGNFGYTNSEVKENHLFKLVSAGNSEISGEPMFYTQNVASGMWFSGSTDGWTVENMEESTPLVIGKASLWTLMEMKVPGDSETNSGYNVQQWVDAGGQEYLTDAEIFPNETKIQVWKWRPSQLDAEDGDALTLGSFDSDYVPGSGIATGFHSIANVWGSAFGYTECWWQNGGTGINPWYAYEAVEVEDPIGDLEALLRDYKDDHLDYKCKAGTDPGCLIDQSVYTKYLEKYQEATDFVEGSPTEAGAEKLVAELKAAREALLKAPRVELTEGLYYITSANWLFEENQQFTGTAEDGSEINQGKVKAMYDRENDILGWADWYKEVKVGDFKRIEKKTDAAYIFRVTKSEKVNGRWDIQNAGTGRFLNGGTAKTTAVITTPQEVMTQEAPANGIFGIRNNGAGSGDMYHCAGHSNGAGGSGSLTTWSFTGASTWNFVRITDQALIDSLNTVMDQKILDNRLKNEIASAEETMKPGYINYINNTLQLSGNANEPSEGALKNLIDGNTSTFYHSSWSTGPAEYHYLQVDLKSPMDKLAVKWYKRTQNNANRPNKITVMGSTDGENWTEAGVLPAAGDTLPWGSATPEYTGVVNITGGPYKAFRFVVNETRTAGGLLCAKDSANGTLNGYPFFTFSEFQVYNGVDEDGELVYQPNSLAYREDVKVAYKELKDAVKLAQSKLGTATEQDIEELKAAVKKFDAAYPDTAILDYVINKAKTFYEQAIPADGDETLLGGYNTEELREALNTTVEAAEADYNKETVTRSYIDQHTAAIQKAIDDFVADVNKPKMGTWYFIKNLFNGADREDSNPYDQLIYAGGKSIGDGIKWGGDTYQGMNDATYLWRFNDLGDGTFSVENFGTGYYMGANRGTSAQYLLSDTVVAFKFGYVAGMELTLEDANYDADVKDLRYIHADAAGNVVTWSAAQYSPSSWTFVEAADEAAPQLLGKAGGMNIITLPFDVATTGEFTNVLGDSEVSVYTLANAVLDEEGKVAQLTLNPLEIPVGGIKAGTPFIIAFPEDADEDGNAVVGLNVDLEAPLNVQATTVNGVVGLLSKDTIKVNGMGYFVGDSHELVAAKKNIVINSQFGYINPKLITNEEAKDGSIVIGIKNGGVLDNIQEAIKDANALVNVVDMSGVIIRTNVKKANALKGLPKGIYIVGGQKVSVK